MNTTCTLHVLDVHVRNHFCKSYDAYNTSLWDCDRFASFRFKASIQVLKM